MSEATKGRAYVYQYRHPVSGDVEQVQRTVEGSPPLAWEVEIILGEHNLPPLAHASGPPTRAKVFAHLVGPVGAAGQTPSVLAPGRESEIRARVKAASPGPWTVRARDYVDGGVRLRDRRIEGPRIYHNAPPEDPVGRQADADAAFLAHAREDVPDLLAEIDRLRRQVVALCATPHQAEAGRG